MELKYLIKGRVYAEGDAELQGALASIYNTSERVRCLCVSGGVEMYISKFKEFVVKRMPDSASRHHPACSSYELPAGDSGLGEVLGEAIIESKPDEVELRLDFPLTRRTGRGITSGEPQTPTEVTFERRKLSMRGLMHFLWDRAGFSRWYPRMNGKRSYWVVRKYLMLAATQVVTKGTPLAERFYVPEGFMREHAAEIKQRREAFFSILVSPDDEVQFKMLLVLGQVKSFEPSMYGYKLTLKHLSDCPLFLDTKGGERIKKVFEQELMAWQSGQVNLVAGCLIYAKRKHVYQVDTLSLMMVTDQWIPVDHPYESDLANKLVEEQRAFLKPLRYEAKNCGGFPNFLLLDAGERPIALDIQSAFMVQNEREAKVRAIEKRDPTGWVWDIAESVEIPVLPENAGKQAFTSTACS